MTHRWGKKSLTPPTEPLNYRYPVNQSDPNPAPSGVFVLERQKLITMKLDLKAVKSRLKSVVDDVQGKALPRALNKIAAQTKVQAARQIRDAGYGIKIGDIKAAIAINQARANSLVAVVKATGRPIGLIKYGARQTKSGVTVAVKKGRKAIPHAFIATMPNGHKGVFIRTGNTHKKVNKSGKTYWSGLQIKELFGPSVPSAFINQTVQDALIANIRDKMPAILAHEIEYLGLKR